MLESFPGDGLAVVVGATGGIGGALLARLAGERSFRGVVGLSQGGAPPLDLTSEETIARAAAHVAGTGRELQLVVDATGFLHGGGLGPGGAGASSTPRTWRRPSPSTPPVRRC